MKTISWMKALPEIGESGIVIALGRQALIHSTGGTSSIGAPLHQTRTYGRSSVIFMEGTFDMCCLFRIKDTRGFLSVHSVLLHYQQPKKTHTRETRVGRKSHLDAKEPDL